MLPTKQLEMNDSEIVVKFSRLLMFCFSVTSRDLDRDPATLAGLRVFRDTMCFCILQRHHVDRRCRLVNDGSFGDTLYTSALRLAPAYVHVSFMC